MRLKLIVVFGIILYLVTAIKSDGFLHGDEHFQIVEFADAKLGKLSTSELPWEFETGLRSTIQPTIAFCIFKTLDFIGYSNPYGQVAVLRILTALLAFFSIFYLIKTVIQGKLIRNQLLFVFCSISLAFLPYLNVRFSSETWAGLLFLLPIAQLLRKDSNAINPHLIGVFLGLSFLFRYQVGFMILGLLLWMIFIKKSDFKFILKTILSILTIVGVGILIDSWFYGEFTVSLWNYFKLNLLDGKASSFGTSPWNYYLLETIRIFGTPLGAALMAIVGGFLFVFRKNPITWVIIPFILVHFLIPHKEYRFLFPIVNLIPLMVFLLLEKLFSWQKTKEKIGFKYLAQTTLAILLVFNLLFVIALSTESAGIGQTEISQFIRNNYSDKSVNLVNTKWANPYKPWGAKLTRYYDDNVTSTEVENLDNNLHKANSINLLVLREIDIKNGPIKMDELDLYKAQVVKESYNSFTKTLGRWFGVYNLNNNLKLYTWERK